MGMLKLDDFDQLATEAITSAKQAKHYEILGLKPGASLDEVRERCKELVQQWHPDLNEYDPDQLVIANGNIAGFKMAYQAISSGTATETVSSASPSISSVYKSAFTPAPSAGQAGYSATTISHRPVMIFFIFVMACTGKLLTGRFIVDASPAVAGVGVGVGIIFGAILGLYFGKWVVATINGLSVTKNVKAAVAFAVCMVSLIVLVSVVIGYDLNIKHSGVAAQQSSAQEPTQQVSVQETFFSKYVTDLRRRGGTDRQVLLVLAELCKREAVDETDQRVKDALRNVCAYDVAASKNDGETDTQIVERLMLIGEPK